MLRTLLISFIFLIFAPKAHSQIDSVGFIDGTILFGEVKSLDKGVLIMETQYSDKDFAAEWNKVAWLKTQNKYLIVTKNLVKRYGYLRSEMAYEVSINGYDTVTVSLMDIVHLSEFEDKFFERLSANIDVGFDLTKANNLKSLSIRSGIKYKGEKWTFDIYYNSLSSTQDNVEPIQRSDASINITRIFLKKWYAIYTNNILSNTEQQLDLRFNSMFGLGRYLFRTNKAYLSLNIAMNRNREKFASDEEFRNSWETNYNTELNLYDIGDLNFLLNALVYSGITEKGRWRADTKFDIKYDLPFDFYIKLGISYNYDNQPQNDASKSDYALQSGIGWEW